MKQAIEDLIARNEAAIAQVGRIQTDAARVINNRNYPALSRSSVSRAQQGEIA